MSEPGITLQTIEDLAARHGSYRTEAYVFVIEALERTLADQGVRQHISGQTLLEGIKALGRERYGVMAADVFLAWGVRETLDFGHIVFQLVEAELLSKRDEDSLEDFANGFDFRQAFETGFLEGKA